MKFPPPKFVIYLKHTGGSNNIGTASIFRFALIKRHVENSIRIFRLSVIGERGERGFTPRKFRLFPPPYAIQDIIQLDLFIAQAPLSVTSRIRGRRNPSPRC